MSSIFCTFGEVILTSRAFMVVKTAGGSVVFVFVVFVLDFVVGVIDTFSSL